MPRFLLPPMRPDGAILRTWRAEAPPVEWRYDAALNTNGLLAVRGVALRAARLESGETQRNYAEYLSSGHTEYTQGDISVLEHTSPASWVNLTLARKLAEVYDLPLDRVVLVPVGVTLPSQP